MPLPSEGHHQTLTKAREASEHRPGCDSTYRRKRLYVYAKRRYMRRDRPLTGEQTRYIRHIAWCLPSRDGTRWAFGKTKQWRAKFRQRLAYYRLTPYVCGFGRSAIPCYIVYCESGGSWHAYNPSGAASLYQIMPFWGRPWPVDSWADKMAHHRIASRIWAGGSGASNWACA